MPSTSSARPSAGWRRHHLPLSRRRQQRSRGARRHRPDLHNDAPPPPPQQPAAPKKCKKKFVKKNGKCRKKPKHKQEAGQAWLRTDTGLLAREALGRLVLAALATASSPVPRRRPTSTPTSPANTARKARKPPASATDANRLPERQPSALPLLRQQDLRPEPYRPRYRLPDRGTSRSKPRSARKAPAAIATSTSTTPTGPRKTTSTPLPRHQHLRLHRGRHALAPGSTTVSAAKLVGSRSPTPAKSGPATTAARRSSKYSPDGTPVGSLLDQHKLLQARDRPHQQRSVHRSLQRRQRRSASTRRRAATRARRLPLAVRDEQPGHGGQRGRTPALRRHRHRSSKRSTRPPVPWSRRSTHPEPRRRRRRRRSDGHPLHHRRWRQQRLHPGTAGDRGPDLTIGDPTGFATLHGHLDPAGPGRSDELLLRISYLAADSPSSPLGLPCAEGQNLSVAGRSQAKSEAAGHRRGHRTSSGSKPAIQRLPTSTAAKPSSRTMSRGSIRIRQPVSTRTSATPPWLLPGPG